MLVKTSGAACGGLRARFARLQKTRFLSPVRPDLRLESLRHGTANILRRLCNYIDAFLVASRVGTFLMYVVLGRIVNYDVAMVHGCSDPVA